MPIWDMKEPPEHPEPQVFCDSCWWCDDISGDSRFGVVMYCHYHEKPRENYHTCDEYEDVEIIERGKRMAEGRE